MSQRNANNWQLSGTWKREEKNIFCSLIRKFRAFFDIHIQHCELENRKGRTAMFQISIPVMRPPELLLLQSWTVALISLINLLMRPCLFCTVRRTYMDRKTPITSPRYLSLSTSFICRPHKVSGFVWNLEFTTLLNFLLPITITQLLL